MEAEEDISYMREALKLAESMRGRTSPDPMVGALIVKDGEIISTGYHAEISTPHAEAWAIEKVGEKARGSTLYLNLEPCCHFGYNPPCTKAIIDAGIKKVVAAMEDPNPIVSGKGFEELREAGIEVVSHVLEEEAKKLNEVFIKFITTRRPFVIMKSAMSLDGKIATKTGDSFWITGVQARRHAHYLRSIVDAVMVGIGTILRDDPELTVRELEASEIKTIRNPLRIILDSKARIPLSSKVMNMEPSRTVIITTSNATSEKIKRIKDHGAEVLVLKDIQGLVDLDELMVCLGGRKITSILIEGGGRVNASAISAGIVDKVVFFISPKIIGGEGAPTPIEGEGIELLSQAIKLKDIRIERINEDIMIEGYIIR